MSGEVLYRLITRLLVPLALARILWRSRRNPAYRERWRERLGFAPLDLPPGGLWIHAVSVGEVVAVAPLAERWLERHPTQPLLITTTTPTGAARVGALFGDRARHVYLPFDAPGCIRRFLDRVQPRLLALVETEIWPELLRQCEHRHIPALLLNARLSARSARNYAKWGTFPARVMNRLSTVAAQTAADRQRFEALGVQPGKLMVTGSVKFDLHLGDDVLAQAQTWRARWPGRPAWIAASTHEGEELQVLEAHRLLGAHLEHALLILAPRHPERGERIVTLIKRLGFSVHQRSTLPPGPVNAEVLLVDSIGELLPLFGASDAAFVGGSLVSVGGHNVLEPAALGLPVCFGPHMFNFEAIARQLRESGGGQTIQDAASLAGLIRNWLTHAALRQTCGMCGQQLVADNRGALDRQWALLETAFVRAENTPLTPAFPSSPTKPS